MTLGPLMVDLVGLTISETEREMLQHPLVGGVILFSRNYQSPEQLAALTADIHAIRQPRLLIAVDHEGGRVQRFRDGFSRLPPVAALGQHFTSSPQQALKLAETTGWLMAAELRAVGVDFSFAPVLDLNYGISEVIGDRAFHRDPQIVSKLATAYISGMKQASMAAVGKHFPGHGSVEVDSHLGLPVDKRQLDDIWLEDMLPFRQLCSQTLAGIMPAHIVYENCDSLPAGFSPYWIQQILRKRMGFQGAVISDDLSMAGAAIMGDSTQRAAAALAAGCDLVLLCNNPTAVETVLDNLHCETDPLRHMRLVRLHGRQQMERESLMASTQWKEAVNAVASYAPDSERLFTLA